MAADLIVQYGFLNTSASGTTTVIAAQPGQRIIVLQCCVITGAANNIKFQSNGVTDVSALFPLAQNGGFVLPYSELGWFQTNSGEALTFNQSGAIVTAVQLVWCPQSS